MASSKIFHAVGKRKSAIARVYLSNGNGETVINSRSVGEYFPKVFQPFVGKAYRVLNIDGKFDADISVAGGGVAAQAAACMYGIAKALCLVDDSNRPSLKKAKLLTRDSRVVERKKYGHKKARKSFQFSKR